MNKDEFGPKLFKSEVRARHFMQTVVNADQEDIEAETPFEGEYEINERTIQQTILDENGEPIRTDEITRWTIEDEDGRFFKFDRDDEDEIVATMTDKGGITMANPSGLNKKEADSVIAGLRLLQEFIEGEIHLPSEKAAFLNKIRRDGHDGLDSDELDKLVEDFQ